MESEKQEMEDRAAAYYRKMTQTPVSRLIFRLGIPTTISMLVTSLYNMVDTYFVGTLGTSASAAVGVVFGLMAIIQAVGFMFGQGAGSIISRKLGSKEGDEANCYASSCFFCSVGCGLIISILGILFLDPFMRLLGSTETILPYSRVYSFYILLAAPFMTASFSMNNVLRYEGKAALAMVGLVTGGCLNMFGDYILICKMNLGIAGAGISTAVSQMISFGILIYPFFAGKTQTRISLSHVKIRGREINNMIRTGLPSLLRQGLNSISTMLLNSQAAMYGDAAVAAMSIVGRICFFIFAVALGIGQGFQPVSGYNFGAKKYSRVKKGCYFTIGFGVTFMGILSMAGLLFSGQLIGCFRDDQMVIEIGIFALKWQLLGALLQPLSVCTNMLFQSTGQNLLASMTAVLRSGLLFIPLILILPQVMGLKGIQIAQPLADVGTFFVSLFFLAAFVKKLPQDGMELKKGNA